MIRLLVIFCFTPLVVLSQSVTRNLVSVAGNSETNGNINLSYSIGEVIIPTVIQESNVLTQGFQQPELIVPRKVSELFRELEIQCYPNPVIENLKIQLNKFNDHQRIEIRIFDTGGNMVKYIIQDITGEKYTELKINLRELPNSLYFVHILIDNNYVANFNFYKAQE